ncbi:uncharacterized protein LOC132661531 [Panthera onca]|uniref:L-lactate dehydrogenase A-like 6A n=1 Tax=Panthera onca TaxID=9690 RepID=UPI00295423D6|nr:L-lactate dehydrogenase A-like 6A [Panthera onca]
MGFGQVVPHLIAGGSLIHCYLLHLVLFEPRSPRSLPETCQLQNCQPSTGAGDKLQAQAGHRPGTMHRNPHSGLASAPGFQDGDYQGELLKNFTSEEAIHHNKISIIGTGSLGTPCVISILLKITLSL